MQYDDAPPILGPLTTAKAFRRSTGASNIIVSLLLADLIGWVVWLLIGALAGSPLWWGLHNALALFHASLLTDIALILILACFAMGYFQHQVLKKSSEDAWGTPGALIVLLLTMLAILWFIKPDWMTIPARIIPPVKPEGLTWNHLTVLLGMSIATGFSLLAHLLVLQRDRQDDQAVRSFSRAHPDGQIWLLIEQAYGIYRRNLTRFDPPPITRLKTPLTFYYYQRRFDPNVLPNPERELYWKGGNLIINQAYIGPKPEQAEVLLPFLARLLYDQNSSDRLVARLFRLAHIGESLALSSWLLAPALYVARKCETRWDEMERDHVLDRDYFAYLCGQGKRLRIAFRRQLDDLTQQEKLDNAVPTLAERIDHLESLIGREARQVKKLRDAALPPGPDSEPPAPTEPEA